MLLVARANRLRSWRPRATEPRRSGSAWIGGCAIEGFFEGLGIAALVVLVLVGLVIGALAGKLTGRSAVLYALIGAAAAIAAPFVLAVLGITVLAAGGLLLVAVVGAVAAAVVVGLVRAVSRRRSERAK
jgi:hypothetical protein